MILAATGGDSGAQAIISGVLFAGTLGAVWFGYRPMLDRIHRRERLYEKVIRGQLLMDISPRTATVIGGILTAFFALLGWSMTASVFGAILFGALASFLPNAILKILRRRRLAKLESQLVDGIQTLSSGVRAGLNLVQAMEMVARDGPKEMRQEFEHMLREYSYGIPLDEAMSNAATRIGSGDYRLLFAALQTHRERGGDLGVTLDRIAESVREIQRLESRVKSLTAQGRATARWLGFMPAIVLVLWYVLISADDVKSLFSDDMGRLILAGMVLLNLVGFLWIRKIVSVDI